MKMNTQKNECYHSGRLSSSQFEFSPANRRRPEFELTTESGGCSLLLCVDLDRSKRGGGPLISALKALPPGLDSLSPPRQLVDRTAASK